MRRIVSCTTREPRPGEVNGREYHFLTGDAFLDAARRGSFVEYDQPYGTDFYGRRIHDFYLLRNYDCIADMTESGVAALQRSNLYNAIYIRLDPVNKTKTNRDEARIVGDANRKRIHILVDHVIHNDHGDITGLEKAFVVLRAIIEGYIHPNT
jgi:guanylate kinase